MQLNSTYLWPVVASMSWSLNSSWLRCIRLIVQVKRTLLKLLPHVRNSNYRRNHTIGALILGQTCTSQLFVTTWWCRIMDRRNHDKLVSVSLLKFTWWYLISILFSCNKNQWLKAMYHIVRRITRFRHKARSILSFNIDRKWDKRKSVR